MWSQLWKLLGRSVKVLGMRYGWTTMLLIEHKVRYRLATFQKWSHIHVHNCLFPGAHKGEGASSCGNSCCLSGSTRVFLLWKLLET